ncbi:MAG: DUF86 domain-containing protein [Chloroflexi bacterium]|nr:DUF86 domain-containing protein [Chloroflexota bacterium]
MQRIDRYVRTLTFEQFCTNDMVLDAVIRNVAVIGEATRAVPDYFQALHPEVPWASMRGMRNILIHEYFDTDLEVLWSTVRDDVPPLIPILQALISTERAAQEHS